MFDWINLLRKPDDLNAPGAYDAWFARIAECLLNGCRLIVGQQPHRLVEVEFYYWSDAHPDPFTHRDPIQFHIGRWYFHRTHGSYRSGSFKGLDLTFGEGHASGGVLFRGMETEDGALIDGPSLCVDHLLDATGAETVAVLDRVAANGLAWEEGNPLRLEATDALERRPLIRSPRVGLLLKRVTSRTESTRFVLRGYRYLSDPRRTKKGKLLMVLALHAQGESIEDIQRLTNSSRRTIERYIADFESGRQAADFTPFFGKDLGPADLSRLYGVWSAHYPRS